MNNDQFIFVGIGGHVAALDRLSGVEVWRTKVKGNDFVNVCFVEGKLYATSGGEITCLDKYTGAVVWHNKLKGLGTGLVTVAGDSSIPVIGEKEIRDTTG